jgi:ArsR family transcriptional regulator, arsenate/arsenite/antimonite-responsive transcriptional repressor
MFGSSNLLDSGVHFYNSRYMESEQAILSLAALAQSTRLGVFRLLVKHEPDGLAAGDIAKALEVPQNTMSAHLAILARAGLVTSERKSRSIIYRANLATLQALTSFMVEDCCGGRADLCAPAAACKPARGRRAKVTA